MTELCRCHKTQNVDQLDERAGPVMQPGILCTGIGQLPVLHSHLASNLLESASARWKNIPPCAAQQERTLVVRMMLENGHYIHNALEGLQSHQCGTHHLTL